MAVFNEVDIFHITQNIFIKINYFHKITIYYKSAYELCVVESVAQFSVVTLTHIADGRFRNTTPFTCSSCFSFLIGKHHVTLDQCRIPFKDLTGEIPNLNLATSLHIPFDAFSSVRPGETRDGGSTVSFTMADHTKFFHVHNSRAVSPIRGYIGSILAANIKPLNYLRLNKSTLRVRHPST